MNPVDSIQALAWQIAGYSHGAMNLPSIPNRNTDTKHAITPTSIIVLHTGCDDIITLEARMSNVFKYLKKNGNRYGTKCVYLLCLFHILKMISPIAIKIPTEDIVPMQINNGNETVRRTVLMIVLS